jgi:SAM-dependent methyltransferase
MTFYRESDILLYQGIAYWLAGWKRYAHALILQLGKEPLSILDYGCGVGQDGLALLDQGYYVTFADLPGRCQAFCQWRLAQRGYRNALIVTLDTADDARLFGHDLVYCMDLIEHLPPAEQPAMLDRLATYGAVVLVNLIDDKRADGRIHYPVDREGLTAHVRKTSVAGAWDVYVMADGNVTRLLLYGKGVQCDATGALRITKDTHVTSSPP